MLDTIHAVQTPEGVDLVLRAAGPVPRALAWTVDTILQAAFALGLGFALAILGGFGGSGLMMGLYSIGLFVLIWFYGVLFEVRAHGQTPGKRMLGLRVVQENGTPVGWSESVLRNFLLVADFLPLLYLTGLVTMFLDASFRRLGDLAAGTLVVYADSAQTRGAGIGAVTPRPPRFALTLDEQTAVIAFAERESTLTPERARELAEIPGPLSAGDDPAEALRGVAAFLVGRTA